MSDHFAGSVPRHGVNHAAVLAACLLFGGSACAPVAAATSDMAGGSIAAMAVEPRVAQFVVRFRPGFEGTEWGTIRSTLQDELQRSLGQSLSTSPSTSVRNHVLRLNQPTSLSEAKRLVGMLRMRPDVVYAELDPGERPRKLASKAATQGSGTPTVRRLMVIFAEPTLATKSRNNETLGVEWDDKLSASAGVPLHVARATIAGAWVVEFLAAVDVATAEIITTRLQADGIARLAAPDYALAPMAFPNDPALESGKQWNLFGPSARPYYGIDAERAWDITTGSPGMVIAVVDSGILPHPDLSTRILAGYNFISDPVSAGNGVGRSNDATDLGNWRTPGLCPAPFDAAADSSWHGTLVTGIVAADSNDGIGIAGIDWNAQVLPVRVSGRCGASTLDMIEGMSWAVGVPVDGAPDNPTPANVINYSLGSMRSCPPLVQEFFDLLLDAGVFIVAAAGNDNADVDGSFPANCLGLSAVGSTDPYGMRASYSNFGQRVDISAPGGDRARYGIAGAIYSTSNFGTTVADAPAYEYVSGTSLASPQVAGVASLMMAVNPNLMPAQIKQLMAQTASPFAAGSDCVTGICGAGIVNAYAAVRAAQTATPPPPINYQGMWAVPKLAESGWGINFTHQGDIIFASWFTYDANGKPWWLTMTAQQQTDGLFTGPIDLTTGPPFSAMPFDPAHVTHATVGTGQLTFSDANNGTFDYTVNGIWQVKALARFVFAAPVPVCTFNSALAPTQTVNYQDMWAVPNLAESGWGINFTHQGDIIFASWFTYGANGQPLWVTATLKKTAARTYAGALDATTGPPFNAVPFDPSRVTHSTVGTASVTFTDGANGTFTYTLNGVTQTKALTRFVFRAPGTVCQ